MIHDALLGRQDNCMAIKCIKKKEHFPFYFHTSSVRCKMKTVVILIRVFLNVISILREDENEIQNELVKKIGSLKLINFKNTYC